MAVDAHLHVFRNEEEGLIAQGGERLAGHAGVLDEVRAIVDRGRVDRVLAFSTLPVAFWRQFPDPAWAPEELEERLLDRAAQQNAWLCEALAGDPSVHPVLGAEAGLPSASLDAHLRGMVERFDVRGFKIHPGLNFVFPHDAGYQPVYRLAAEAGLPVVSHGGSGEGTVYESPTQYCAPEEFAPVLREHPQLDLVIAHLGQPFFDSLLELAAAFPNVRTDLSFVVGGALLPLDRLRDVVRGFGVERVLFGSDFPYFDPEESLDRLLAAGLSEGEVELVTAANASALFNLD